MKLRRRETLLRGQNVSLAEKMRRDWDARARRDAFHYIASWKPDWKLEDFLVSGEQDYTQLVAPVLERCRIPAAGDVMIELGCGAGRMTRNFARRYKRVIASDLSAEMLRRARQIHASEQNILWLRIAGADLACLANGSADFIFSYLVLQHIPSQVLAMEYIHEMLRVLRPGGAFLFQFNANRRPTMNLRGRLTWGVVDKLWSVGLARVSQGLASLAGLDPALSGKSWRGAALDAGAVAAAVQNANGEVREIRDESSAFAWCCGVKRSQGH
jgi:SAM-dependent methyltransferase